METDESYYNAFCIRCWYYLLKYKGDTLKIEDKIKPEERDQFIDCLKRWIDLGKTPSLTFNSDYTKIYFHREIKMKK